MKRVRNLRNNIETDQSDDVADAMIKKGTHKYVKTGGFNPIRHDCKKQGCYMDEYQFKSEVFADCFPRMISFSDLDRIVELNGRGLIMEWKRFDGDLENAQIRMWELLTRGRILTVIAVRGNPKTLEVTHIKYCKNGKWDAWEQCDLDGLKTKLKEWVNWAEKQRPVFSINVLAV